MVDAVNERAAVELGRNADLVLSNPAYADAMARMKSEVIATWKDCPVRDREGQFCCFNWQSSPTSSRRSWQAWCKAENLHSTRSTLRQSATNRAHNDF